MIVTCEHCGVRYKLDDSKITGRGAKIKCPRCRNQFVVYRSAVDGAPQDGGAAGTSGGFRGGTSGGYPGVTAQAAAPARPQAVPETPPIDVHSLDFRRVGIASWKVKVKIGLVYDFSDYRTLRKYIQDGRVTPGDSISYDAAETWVPIASIPDLEQYFIDTYVKRQADTKPNGREAGEDDGPTVIVGAGTLASSISAHLAAPPAAAPPGASVSGTSAAAAFAASVSSGSAPSNGVGYGGDVAVSSQSRSGMAIPGLSATAPMAADDPTSETSGPFSDPFEALKSKQRSRIKRNRTASRVKKTARGGNEGSGSSIDVKAVVAGLVLIVATGVVAWEVWEFWLRPAVPITEAEWAAMQAPRDPALLPAGSEARATFPEGASPDAWEKKLKEIYTTDRRTPISGANPEDEVRAVQPRNLPPPVPTNVGAGNTVPRASSAADYALAGKAAMDRGDYPIAIQSFNQAIKLEPQNAGHYAQLGIAQARAGNTVEANTTLARAAKLGSTVAEREMGNIARDRGDVAGALQHYTVYLRTDPPDQEAVQAEIDKLQGK